MMTNLELTILGLLAEQPAHGYQLEQIIEARNVRDWAEIGFSSIYYILNKLEKKDWVSSSQTASEGKGPGRKIYTPTPAGYIALEEAILASLSTPQNRYSAFLLGLANLPGVSPEKAIAALEQHLSAQIKTRAAMQAQEQHLPPNTPLHVRAMFDFSNTQFEAELHWIEMFIAQLRERKTP